MDHPCQYFSTCYLSGFCKYFSEAHVFCHIPTHVVRGSIYVPWVCREAWEKSHTKRVTRALDWWWLQVYDKTVKGYVYSLNGGPASKLQLPKDDTKAGMCLTRCDFETCTGCLLHLIIQIPSTPSPGQQTLDDAVTQPFITFLSTWFRFQVQMEYFLGNPDKLASFHWERTSSIESW